MNRAFDQQLQRLLNQAQIDPNKVAYATQSVEYSSIFYGAAVALTQQSFFTSTQALNPRWQTVSFNGGTGSDVNTRWIIYGIAALDNVVTNAATGLPQALATKSFLDNSYLNISNAGSNVKLATIPYANLVDYEFVRNGSADGFTTIRKTNSKFTFDDKDVITVGGGNAYLFDFYPPTNLTTGAGVALPDPGPVATGYYVKLQLFTYKIGLF